MSTLKSRLDSSTHSPASLSDAKFISTSLFVFAAQQWLQDPAHAWLILYFQDRVDLINGMSIPLIGMGTYAAGNDQKAATENAIKMAIKVGYKHFDTAQVYGSEPALGNALNDAISNGVIERESLFITSKLWGSHHHDPVSALKQSLMNLRMEYVDMYLVHWPVRFKPWVRSPYPREDEDFEPLQMEMTWTAMERCLDMGLCKGIGVSNFSCKKVEKLLDFAAVTPTVNQVEMHPTWRQALLRDYCADNKIHVSAYSPIGGPGNYWGSMAVIENPIIKSIAFKHKATPAQVALRWGMSKGSSVIVKSFNEERLRENMGALDLELEDIDIFEIEKLEEKKILRGECYVNQTTSPYKSIQDLWDGEI